MYLQHYNLQQLPFRNTPDPRFFYETSRHNEALANLVYAVEQRRGFVLLSGEIGSGKTLVTHLLLQHLEDHAQIALIRNTHLNSAQLIRLVCDEFSVQVHAQADKAAMLLALNQFLIQQLAEDRLVVIIIDEAQNLSDKVLEELRMLSNLETSSDKLLQIVLVGQPELRDKVSQPHLEQLRQRIALSYHLEPLTLEEIAQYIQHRLKVAAGDGPANVEFTPEAVARIARFSRGTPRIINGLCDNALLYGFTSQTHTIDEALIDKVLKHSMHLVPRHHSPTRSPLNGFGGASAGSAADAGADGTARPMAAAAAKRFNPAEASAISEQAGTESSAAMGERSRPRDPARDMPRPRPQPVAATSPEGPVPEDAGPKKAPGGAAEVSQEKTLEGTPGMPDESPIAVPPIIPFPGRLTHPGSAAQ